MAATFTLQTSPDNVTWTTRVSQGGDQHSSPKSTDSNFKYTGGDSWRYCKITANVNNFNYGHCQGLFKNGSPTSTVNLVATNGGINPHSSIPVSAFNACNTPLLEPT